MLQTNKNRSRDLMFPIQVTGQLLWLLVLTFSTMPFCLIPAFCLFIFYFICKEYFKCRKKTLFSCNVLSDTQSRRKKWKKYSLVTTEQILNTSFSTHFYVGVKSFHFQMHRLQNLVVEEGYLCFVVDYSSRSDIASVSLP